MKNRARILCTAMLLSSGGQAIAQSAPDAMASPASANTAGAAKDFDEIVVTGARQATAIKELPLSLSVVGGEDLAQQLRVNQDVQDVLNRTVPGLTLNPQEGGASTGTGTGPLLRGRTATVLINGVPVNTILRGNAFDLNLVDTFAIDRVEVQRGASATFGFGASGGVINLLTRRGRSQDLQVILRSALSFNTDDVDNTVGYKFYAGLGQALPSGLDYYFGGAISHLPKIVAPSGHATLATDEMDYNVDSNIGYSFSNDSALRLTFNLIHRNIKDDIVGPTAFLPYTVNGTTITIPNGTDPRIALRDPSRLENEDEFQTNYVVLLNYSHPNILGSALNIDLFHQWNKKRIIFLGGPAENNNFYVNKRYGLRSSLTTPFRVFSEDDLSFTYGFDFVRDQMTRPFTYQGGPLTRTVEVKGYGPFTYNYGGAELRPIVPPLRLDAYAFFMQSKFEIGQFILSGGIRHEEFRPKSLGSTRGGSTYPRGDLASFNSTLFNAGVIWNVSDSFQVYGGLSQGTEITELGRVLRNEARNQPASVLQRISGEPARTTEYELGIRGSINGLNYTLAGYYSRAPLSSQVAINPLDRTGVLIPIREPQRTKGIETTIDYSVNPQWKLGGIVSYQEGKRKCDPTFNTTADCTIFTPQPSTRISPANVSAYVEYSPAERTSARVQLTKVFDRNVFATRGNLNSFDERGNVEGYFLVDALVNIPFGPGIVSLGAKNLLNETYVPVARQAENGTDSVIPGEGRRITIGYNIDF